MATSGQISNLRRAGINVVIAVTCAYVVNFTGDFNPTSVGAIAGAAAATLTSAVYGLPTSNDDVSRHDLMVAAGAALIGFVLAPAIQTLNIPAATTYAVACAMVIAAATEVIKNSGLTASFRALMYTAIVSVLGAGVASGIGQYNANMALIGAIIGLFGAVIGTSALSAFFGMAGGEVLRNAFDWTVQTIAVLLTS